MSEKKRNRLENERHELSLQIEAIEASANTSADRKHNDIYNCKLRIKIITEQLGD